MLGCTSDFSMNYAVIGHAYQLCEFANKSGNQLRSEHVCELSSVCGEVY